MKDKSRPRRDRARDIRDRTADVLDFIGVTPGDRVIDFLPFRGYFTRLFASLVGERGHVFALIPESARKIDRITKGRLEVDQITRESGNVSVLESPDGELPGSIDLCFIGQNYHDLHHGFIGPVDMRAFNEVVYRVLKPEGAYVIVDHVACPDAATKLHRIDPAIVLLEVGAAGFEFAGKHDVLRNRDDPHTSSIFARGIRYRTDRFIFKFRKSAP
ncbi:class I SAM-dependent methyltransferase [Caballeronia novacaledonica]|nr:class I SAM-dependent methyltransferase [Caballeronia novacaledonica]